ncbi:MAG: J domain-containing protein [Acetobacteraceae bacterium]|nr:J domain-containing protein [Acetobacteraceae bacterium]
MKDPYQTLGVQRSDNAAAIRAAYRKLAKIHHPDLNPGKPEAAERFKEISTAYELLSDADKRARFDKGEIDAAGNEVPPERPFYRDISDGPGGHQRYQGNFDPEDLESIFAQAFAGRRAGGQRFTARGSDAHYTLTVGFLDAANGTTRRITLPEGKTLDVRIPAGVQDGQVIRLKGQGSPGIGGGPAGDALVEVAVAPHALFHREGDDIIIELPVTLQEAVLGATLEVPTIKGKVRLTIPPGSGTGTQLRLRGRGIRQGHQFVRLHVVLPAVDEPELAAFLKEWKPNHPANPRAGLEEG